MKSERRHELQHNELADWLAKTAEAIRPHQNTLLAGLVTVLIVVLGYTWWSRASAARTTEAWDQVSAVLESDKISELAQVTEDYPDTCVGHMAAVVLADARLAEGCSRLFTDKANAQHELDKAIRLYTVVRQRSRTPSLVERATFGLARAKESKGDLEPAEKLYEEITLKWPERTYALAASKRLEDLKRPATKKLYDDFRHFDPKPSFSSESVDRPSFDLESLSEDALDEMPASISDWNLDEKDKNQPNGAEENVADEPGEQP